MHLNVQDLSTIATKSILQRQHLGLRDNYSPVDKMCTSLKKFDREDQINSFVFAIEAIICVTPL